MVRFIKTQETLHKEKYKRFVDKVIKKIKDAGYLIDKMDNGHLCVYKDEKISWFKKKYHFLHIDYGENELCIPEDHTTTQKDIDFFNNLEKKTGLQIVKYI